MAGSWGSIGNSFLQGMYGAQDMAYRRELRDRQRREYEDQEAIRRAGGEGFAAPQPAAPGLSPVPVPGAADGAPARDPALMPVAAEVGGPIAPRGELQRVPLAVPGSEEDEFRRGEANLKAVGLSPVPTTPRGALPGTGDMAQVPTDPVVNVESQVALPTERVALNQSPGQPAPAPAAPGIAPAAAPRQQRTNADWQRLQEINQRMMASSAEALKRGRADLALDYHVKGMKARDELRMAEIDAAKGRYAMTGDPNVFLDVYNKYVADGTNLTGIRRIQGAGPDGKPAFSFEIAGESEGTPFKQTVDADTMERMVKAVQDPAALRAMDTKRAEELYKLQAKIAEMRADPSKRFVNAKPGEMVIDTQTAQTFTAPRDPNEKLRYVENDGAVTEIWSGTQKVWESASAGVPGMPKQVRDLENRVVQDVFRFHKVSDLSGLDPETQGRISAHMTAASQLIAANYDRPDFGQLGQGEIVAIAADIASGKIKPVMRNVNGVPTPTEVVWNGRRIPMIRPREVGAGGAGSPQNQQVSAPALPRAEAGRPAGTTAAGKISGVPSALPPGVKVTRLD